MEHLGRFDSAVLFHVLLHARDPLKILQNCAAITDREIIIGEMVQDDIQLLPQYRARQLGKEAFDEIEPRSMGRCEGEREAPYRLRGEPGCGLARDMGGMVVEDDLDRGIGGVGHIEELEELDEFAAAVAVLDQVVDVTGEQIDPRHQGQSAVPLVFVIAHHGRAFARQGRAIRRGRPDRLDPWFLVIRDDGEAPVTTAVLYQALLSERDSATQAMSRMRNGR